MAGGNGNYAFAWPEFYTMAAVLLSPLGARFESGFTTPFLLLLTEGILFLQPQHPASAYSPHMAHYYYLVYHTVSYSFLIV